MKKTAKMLLVSLILITVLILALAITGLATAGDFEYVYPDGTVTVDGSTDVTIDLEFRLTDDKTVRRIECVPTNNSGYNEDGVAPADYNSAYFTLQSITKNEDMDDDAQFKECSVYPPTESFNYGSFEIKWTYTIGTDLSEGDAVFTASYLVKGSTPAGTYTITLPGMKTRIVGESLVTSNYTATIVVQQATSSTHTVTWKSQDGTTTLDTSTVNDGDTPAYPAGFSEPTKANTAQYTYAFAGWANSVNQTSGTVLASLPAVTADVTYYAAFSETLNKYNVTFVDEDGTTVLKAATQYDYGTAAADIVRPADPTKAATAQYTYTFNGWSPAIATVTGNATYTATYTSTVNSYTVIWAMGTPPADEATTKATVDALIADIAQRVYNDARTEGDFAWEYGVMSHETLVTYHLNAGHVGSNESSAYIAKRIIEIVDNNSADFTAANALWDACKNTIATDFAAFTGYTNNDTGVTYAGLTSEQIATLNSLAGSTTAIETDNDVPYGTAPSFDSATPTKTGDAQYSYIFAGWSTDGETVISPLPNVTGTVTYIAVFTQTTNSYTVTWATGTPAADEATTKATVDAIIEDIAQQVYNDARTEGDMAWNFGWFTHEQLVNYHLDAGHVGSSESSAYIAKRIIEIVDNNSADFTAANALWDACKNTIASDFAAFTGYTNNDTGVTYAGLTSEQIATLNGLAGSTTAIETDNDVPYGTAPSFDSATPTKTGDAQYSYTFAGWSTDGETVISPLPNVTGTVTYIAVFTQTTNTYTVTWATGTPAADEATTKATVDAIIADIAQQVYNDARTEGDMMWDLGWMTHEALVAMHVSAGGVDDSDSANYIAKRVVALVENDSTILAAAEAAWDACKDTIATDFAGFTGYTTNDTGVTYAGLTSEQIATLNGLAGSTTVLETDANVSYGTTPSYDSATPTKTGNGNISYAFSGWSPEITAVTGNVTYIAQFDTVYSLPFQYQTKMNDVETDKNGGTIKYTYGKSISVPSIRYYTLDHWTLTADGTTDTYDDAAALSAAVKYAIDNDDEITAVKAFFVRQTYTLSIYNVVNGGDPVYKEGGTANLGRSLWISAPQTITQGETTYTFSGWRIVTPNAVEGEPDVVIETTELKTSYFNGEQAGITVNAYAYYTTDGSGGTTVDAPKVTVRDYFVEPKGDTYIVGMTLEVIAPTDTTNFSINYTEKSDGTPQYRVGFGYTTNADNAAAGNFGDKLSGNWGSDWTSGTYVMRFSLAADRTWYSFGFVDYTLNGVSSTRYATYAHQDSAERVDYDTINYNGPVR